MARQCGATSTRQQAKPVVEAFGNRFHSEDANACRSELDELYKTIYDLKKDVRQLGRMLEIDGEVAAQETVAEAPAAAPKATGRGKKA